MWNLLEEMTLLLGGGMPPIAVAAVLLMSSPAPTDLHGGIAGEMAGESTSSTVCCRQKCGESRAAQGHDVCTSWSPNATSQPDFPSCSTAALSLLCLPGCK